MIDDFVCSQEKSLKDGNHNNFTNTFEIMNLIVIIVELLRILFLVFCNFQMEHNVQQGLFLANNVAKRLEKSLEYNFKVTDRAYNFMLRG